MGSLYVGSRKSGDRLTSIRQLARELEVDHRIVARAYDALALEGLVEVRDRSGVFLTDGSDLAADALHETDRWMASVLADAWERGIPLRDFARLVQGATGKRLLVGCVESTEDHEVAIYEELRNDFGVRARKLRIGAGGEPKLTDSRSLAAGLREVDFVVTTVFHASVVRPVARELGKPIVEIAVNPLLTEAIRRLLREGEVTVVAVDPVYGQRARAYLGKDDAARLTVILVGGTQDLPAPSDADRILWTRAARKHKKLGGSHLLSRPIPFIAPTSARAIADVMVRLNSAPLLADPKKLG